MTTDKRIAFVLEELCTRHGLCLSPGETARIANDPPDDADAFTQEVFRVEGLDPRSERDLYRTVRATIAKAFANAPTSDG